MQLTIMTITYGSPFEIECAGATVWFRGASRTVRTAQCKHRQDHKYGTATDVCWCIKRWMWVLQSHGYLSSELLMTCTACGMFLCTSWPCTEAEV